MMIVTMICPEALFPAANQYARARGASPDDEATWLSAPFEKDGVAYGVINTAVRPEWLAAASSPLQEPAWGSDLVSAQQAQLAIRLWAGQGPLPPASPTTILALVGIDGPTAVSLLGLEPVQESVP